MIAINMPEDGPRREVTRKISRRILALFETNPVFVKMSSVGFMALPEFDCRDLNPTLKEVVIAFEIAHVIWNLKHEDQEKL